MPEIRSQLDQRVSTDPNHTGDFFTDQWGREYHAEVEIVTNHPCSPLRPVGWTAPLDTPDSYFRILRGRRARGEARKPYDVEIDYEQWIKDWQQSAVEWEGQAVRLATELYGAQWDRTKGFPPDVLLRVGPRPGAKLEAVRAAQAGHPYVLGLRPYDPSKETDRALRAILFPEATAQGTNWLADEAPTSGPAEAAAPPRPGRPRKPVGRPVSVPAAVGVDDAGWVEGKE